MASIFRKDDNVENHPGRNTFDLSQQNNLTLKMGKLIPVFKKLVYPGDSIRIQPTFGLRYLPQVFPVQTTQRASIKYYYVRFRNLWKDWSDFIGKTKTGLTPPYLKFSGDDNKLLAPSSLADYMGIPVHIKPSIRANNELKAAQPNFVRGNQYLFAPNSNTTLSNEKGDPWTIQTRKYLGVKFGIPSTLGNQYCIPMSWLYGGAVPTSPVAMPQYLTNDKIGTALRPVTYSQEQVYISLYRKPIAPSTAIDFSNVPLDEDNYLAAIIRDTTGVDHIYRITQRYNTLDLRNQSISSKELDIEGNVVDSIIQFQSIVGYIYVNRDNLENFVWPDVSMTFNLMENDFMCWCDVAYSDLPFASDIHPDRLRLSAFYPRAIQSIYNALIRHAENNPFMINGQPEYNKYITSDDGGAVSDVSDLLGEYRSNWSDDRFTTALPSPQQGNAPLVGLTGTTGATFIIGNEDGTQSTIKLQVDSSTGNIVGVNDQTSTASADLVSQMWNAVDYGISINDLRNVNSYQRWKENNIRGGYKYRDQIQTHYGVSVKYDVLDMPEFIGGVSRDVNVSQVTQNVENEFGNLGDYAGQSGVTGQGQHIEHYCDEHGLIIGILCVYPTPIYQDTLAKDWLITDAFDLFFPEFGKIGPQPITNKEIAFSQSFLEGNQDGTFGYQRAWYDMLESLDEVHGLFQTDFRNFLIARDFLNVPTLGSDFLTIDAEDVNNTFYSEDDKDKILGQVYHDISMKRPVPLVGIPSLE